MRQRIDISSGLKPDVQYARGQAASSLKLGVTVTILGGMAVATLLLSRGLTLVVPLSLVVLLSGILEAVCAFHERDAVGYLVHLVPAIAAVPIGILIVVYPKAIYPKTSLMTSTFLFASYLTVIGLFRVASAARLKFGDWHWPVLDGAVTLLLGALLWSGSDWLDSWLPGLAIGISLVFHGWSTVASARSPATKAAKSKAQLPPIKPVSNPAEFVQS
jgi:uncharacterized membrane protein HdeD (DUF308 family)